MHVIHENNLYSFHCRLGAGLFLPPISYLSSIKVNGFITRASDVNCHQLQVPVIYTGSKLNDIASFL